MCWYSVDSEQQSLQAEVGQRLAIRKMHSGHSWVVEEGDVENNWPAPVCLLDGTRVLFRPVETEQTVLLLGPEPEAVFRMTGQVSRDVFELHDGRQIAVDQLPAGLIFDVLVVPGREHLSSVLNTRAESQQADDSESVVARLLPASLKRFALMR